MLVVKVLVGVIIVSLSVVVGEGGGVSLANEVLVRGSGVSLVVGVLAGGSGVSLANEVLVGGSGVSLVVVPLLVSV